MEDVYGQYAEALRAGHQFAASGQLKDALRCYRAATELAAERALPHVALGGTLLRLGQARDALAAYERALELEPDQIDALTGRAAALLAAGRRAEAAQVQEQIKHGPAVTSAPAGHATPASGADRYLASGEQARRAGKIDAAIDAWLSESAEHRVAGHHDAALDACLRALALDSSAPRIHLEIARAWLARGWPDRAAQRLQLLERLLALQPDKNVAAAARELFSH
ncbi:MAG: Tetratricopeptide repeat [Chloroflexota bacterium]|jgi:tetratricopeptide (TPR) repeat protein|nr:Tetratricopeptide repeat [Chloroflexota bacterium]